MDHLGGNGNCKKNYQNLNTIVMALGPANIAVFVLNTILMKQDIDVKLGIFNNTGTENRSGIKADAAEWLNHRP